ncbi:hypothetical protein [Helicobacter salomonis]|nr:hypothetical protein [Helicobacter salomonis]
MRIGATNLSEVKKSDYENPTIISFENLTHFLQHYKAQAGRPKTKWNDVKISHAANDDMGQAKSSEYNSYLKNSNNGLATNTKNSKLRTSKGRILNSRAV